ncbi:(Fe-S)-binding protein [Enemella evansiae]|uniref:(Fe-S)-binding protein n=1 Tax=Enemella evansiae TaxID=2016499 RepID=UPI000B97A0DC|nr:(Fe-S)-binding protein [Enemella evansiae]OYN93824.1 Fe-S oxidoreductase [Enemella evansiae]OYO05899.1 Fe-S oxidoreductase [Enemella evansiae]PFG66597.1 L-lactate dehydrogenase complex protein LldE [Propionibacteriaceae bacterium ES.041]TDO92467.1 L-lactate dehydrogenase complex protein LldE [Enemella evansiae]
MTEMTTSGTISSPGKGIRVALFATCINDTMYPQTARAVVTLLERLGCSVDFPMTQTCCGQPFTNTGYFDEAMGSVRTFVDSFADYDHVVVPSGSCAGSVRTQHAMLARRAGDQGLSAAVEEVAPRTRELSEFLVDVLGVTDVGAYFPHRVTYHPTCHSLRVVRVGDRPLRLLQAVRGLTLLPLAGAEECCGFGGTFAVKNADISVSMGGDKVRHTLDTGAEYLVAGDNSCLTHLGGLLSRQQTGVRPIHLAEILASTEEDR